MLTEMTFSDVFHDILSFVNPRHAFVRAGDEFTRTLLIADKGVLIGKILTDAKFIGRAIYTDCKTTRNGLPGKRTIKVSAKAAGGWAGSYIVGAAGTGVGIMFGGVGAMHGGIIGGWVGSFAGSFLTEAVMDIL